LLLAMRSACDAYDINTIRSLLLNSHIAFTPSDSNCDLVALTQIALPDNANSMIKRVV
jgi:hypothetical protein